ncbi:MAG: DUF934 domain-containing protein [Solimonas sp.]
MSTLIRNGRVEPNGYVETEAGIAISGDTGIVVPLERWLQERAALADGQRPVGVRLPNTVSIDDVWPQIADRPLIELDFPSFGDGRAYSQARVLRERFRYTGEIRATGQAVVRDQLQSMRRVGIDSFVLRTDQDPDICLQALNDFDLAYQQSSDELPVVRRLRLHKQPAGQSTQ